MESNMNTPHNPKRGQEVLWRWQTKQSDLRALVVSGHALNYLPTNLKMEY
jgi:hypothetical protein